MCVCVLSLEPEEKTREQSLLMRGGKWRWGYDKKIQYGKESKERMIKKIFAFISPESMCGCQWVSVLFGYFIRKKRVNSAKLRGSLSFSKVNYFFIVLSVLFFRSICGWLACVFLSSFWFSASVCVLIQNCWFNMYPWTLTTSFFSLFFFPLYVPVSK